jgi:hypothetical protein
LLPAGAVVGAWNIGVGIAELLFRSDFFSLFLSEDFSTTTASGVAFFTARLRVFFGSSAIAKSFFCTLAGEIFGCAFIPDQPTAPIERSGDLFRGDYMESMTQIRKSS